MVESRLLYVVDYHAELLGELKRNLNRSNIRFIRNNGTDFPEVPDHSIDFLFSFGCFVHLDLPLIRSYLGNMHRILKPGANVVLHYCDKTKLLARMYEGYSENNPEIMRAAVQDARFNIVEEDLTSLWHSSVVRFTP